MSMQVSMVIVVLAMLKRPLVLLEVVAVCVRHIYTCKGRLHVILSDRLGTYRNAVQDLTPNHLIYPALEIIPSNMILIVTAKKKKLPIFHLIHTCRLFLQLRCLRYQFSRDQAGFGLNLTEHCSLTTPLHDSKWSKLSIFPGLCN